MGTANCDIQKVNKRTFHYLMTEGLLVIPKHDGSCI